MDAVSARTLCYGFQGVWWLILASRTAMLVPSHRCCSSVCRQATKVAAFPCRLHGSSMQVSVFVCSSSSLLLILFKDWAAYCPLVSWLGLIPELVWLSTGRLRALSAHLQGTHPQAYSFAWKKDRAEKRCSLLRCYADHFTHLTLQARKPSTVVCRAQATFVSPSGKNLGDSACKYDRAC